MTAPQPKLTDALLREVLTRRSTGAHKTGELVGDVMAAVEALPQGRRWSLPLARPRRLVTLVIAAGLILSALIGFAFVAGSRHPTLPAGSGLIAYVTATWGWEGHPTVERLAIAAVGKGGGEPTDLVALPGEANPTWPMIVDQTATDVRLGPALVWSPDGSRVAFRLYADQPGIYVMNRDGSGLRRVAEATGEQGGDAFSSSFAWSPDGTRVAFISPDVKPWPPDAARNGRLYVVDVDRADVRVLNESAAGTVSWSPDGSTIAFARSQLRTSTLVLINADGSGERSFEYAYLGRNHPGAISWSPDGSAIAFIQERFGEDPGPGSSASGDYLMVVNADGTAPREVAYWESGCCYHGPFGGMLEWSPDGRLIATEKWPGGNPGITVWATDGSGERLSLTGYHADWSPDGSQLVFSGRGPSVPGSAQGWRSTAIYVVDADGSDQRWLANGDYPAWSP
jgi:Tol biopolymer transport system component